MANVAPTTMPDDDAAVVDASGSLPSSSAAGGGQSGYSLARPVPIAPGPAARVLPIPPPPPARVDPSRCQNCSAGMPDWCDDWCYQCNAWGRPRVKSRDGRSTRLPGARGGRKVTPRWTGMKDDAAKAGPAQLAHFLLMNPRPKTRHEDETFTPST